MHFVPEEASAHVVGKLNWFPVFFAAIFLWFSHLERFLLVALGAVLLISYLIQARRYSQVAKALSGAPAA